MQRRRILLAHRLRRAVLKARALSWRRERPSREGSHRCCTSHQVTPLRRAGVAQRPRPVPRGEETLHGYYREQRDNARVVVASIRERVELLRSLAQQGTSKRLHDPWQQDHVWVSSHGVCGRGAPEPAPRGENGNPKHRWCVAPNSAIPSLGLGHGAVP